MKVSRSGGHEQGILMGFPVSSGIPSQSPVPVGFCPALTPNSGTRVGSDLRSGGMIQLSEESLAPLTLILVLVFIVTGVPVTERERRMVERNGVMVVNFIFGYDLGVA